MTQTPTDGQQLSREERMKIQMGKPIAEDQSPWYALRLFTLKQLDIAEMLGEKGLDFFIPLHYVDYEDKNGRRRTKLKPVVTNLIFVKKTFEPSFLTSIVEELPYKMMVMRKNRDSKDYYEIPARQMYDFRVMCNPDLLIKKFMSEEEAKLKIGTKVEVTHGPLKGLSGKLVRQSHKYYLLKEVPGMAVMLKVTRWCCRPVEE